MPLDWQNYSSYKPGTEALFWVNDGWSEFVVLGVVEMRGSETEPSIWDDNDFGYGPARNIRFWAKCNRPQKGSRLH